MSERFKNRKHLVDLLNSLTITALRLLTDVDKFEFLKPLDWSKDDFDVRRDALGRILAIKEREAVIADQDAIRILQLAGWRSEELLEYAARNLDWESHPNACTFDPTADVMTRLIWLRANASNIFDRIETIFMAHHFHGHKKYKAFVLRDGDGREFVWSEDIGRRLQEEAGRILQLEEEAREECEVIHFEMDELGADGGSPPGKLHYVVVHHPGTMKLLREMKDRRRDILAFYPALEATLIYDPPGNRVLVLSEKKPAVCQDLADCFSKLGFDSPLSAQPVEEAFYDLSIFKSPVDLMAARARGGTILAAWIPSMTVSLGHTRHRIKLLMNGEVDTWQALRAHLGEADPITRCRSVHEVNLSFVVVFDGESDRRALDLSVNDRGSSNLMNLPDPKLRYAGEDILVSLGAMKHVESTRAATDVSVLLSELELLDQRVDNVDGYLLQQLGLSAQQLVLKGLVKKKAPGKAITVVVDDEADGLAYRRLEVQFDSRHVWAEDEITQRRYDLDEGDLCRYSVTRGWLIERLMLLLAEQLTGKPIDPDQREPFFLGYYRIGDQGIPISLATGIWHSRHADAVDIELRKQNLGVGIVLTTTTRQPRKFLASSIVVPIGVLLDGDSVGVKLDLCRLEGEFRRWKGPATSVERPRLIGEKHGAVLIGPWDEPWGLSRAERIASVKVLVDAWLSGKKKCTNAQVLAHHGGARTVPERFRGDSRWTKFIRSADGKKRSRLWELNIGRPDYDRPEGQAFPKQ